MGDIGIWSGLTHKAAQTWGVLLQEQTTQHSPWQECTKERTRNGKTIQNPPPKSSRQGQGCSLLLCQWEGKQIVGGQPALQGPRGDLEQQGGGAEVHPCSNRRQSSRVCAKAFLMSPLQQGSDCPAGQWRCCSSVTGDCARALCSPKTCRSCFSFIPSPPLLASAGFFLIHSRRRLD